MVDWGTRVEKWRDVARRTGRNDVSMCERERGGGAPLVELGDMGGFQETTCFIQTNNVSANRMQIDLIRYESDEWLHGRI